MQLTKAILATLALTGSATAAAKPKPVCKNSPPGGQPFGPSGYCWVMKCNTAISGPVQYRTTAPNVQACFQKCASYKGSYCSGVKYYKPNGACTYHYPPQVNPLPDPSFGPFPTTPNNAFDSMVSCELA